MNWNKILTDKTFYWLLASGMFAFVVLYLVAAFRVGASLDDVYYLGSSKLMYNGAIPYRDFTLGYPPIAMLLLFIPRCFSDSYIAFLLFIYAVSFVNAFLLFSITKQVTKNRFLALTALFLFLLYNVYFEQVTIYLEPFVLLFGLAGFRILLSDRLTNVRLLATGALMACAFFTKQYGFGFLAISIFYLLINNLKNFRKLFESLLMLMSGFLAVVFIFVILVLFCKIPIDVFFTFGGSSYGQRKISLYFLGLKEVIIDRFAFIILTLSILFFSDKTNLTKLFLTCLAGIFIFAFQFYFNKFNHYVVLLLPFIILAMILFLKMSKHFVKKRPFFYLILLWFIIQSLFAVHQVFVIETKKLIVENARAKQEQQSADIAQITDKQPNSVIAIGWCFTTLLYNNWQPPLLQKYGYSFAGAVQKAQIAEQITRADMVLLDKAAVKYKDYYGVPMVFDFNFSHFEQKITSDSTIYVFVRKY